MKAFLLAAGLGTRLRPLTETIPKCLVPIQDKPLLGWWLDLLAHHGVTEVLINTHYLSDQVSAFLKEYTRHAAHLRTVEFYEPELLGSGGTVRVNRAFVKGDTDFLICYADNLTTIDITAMRAFHANHDSLLTMALFRAESPHECGVAELDRSGRIISYEEKPDDPRGNLANAGIYIARQELFDYIPDKRCTDFGRDVFPQIKNAMFGWETQDYILDIGTPKKYQKAQKEWPI